MRYLVTVLMIFNGIINLFDHLTSLFSIKRRKCWNLRLSTTNHMRLRIHFLTMHYLIILFGSKHFSTIVLKLIITGKTEPWLFSDHRIFLVRNTFFFVDLSYKIIESTLQPFNSFLIIGGLTFSLKN